MRRSDGLALLSALCVVSLFYWQGVFGGKVFSAEDSQLVFFTSRNNLYNVVHGGSLSFWEERRGLGVPRFGEPQAGYLSPLSAIFYLLPTTTAFRFYPALMIFSLWAGTYGLFRQRRAKPVSAALGAYSFVSLGMILHHVEHPPVIETLVWTPVSLFLMDRYFLTGKSRWAVLCSLTYGAMIVAGSAQYLVFGSLLLLGWGASHLLKLWREGESWLPAAGWMATVAVAGILISAPSLLPVLEYAENSHRTLLTSRKFFESGNASLEIVLLSLSSELMSLKGAPQIPGIPYSMRAGLSGVTLLFAAIALRQDRRRALLCIPIVLFLLGMMGDTVGVSKLLGIIPGGGLLRQHIRMFVPAALLICWLAVQGLEDLTEQKVCPTWASVLAILWVIVVGFGSNRGEARFSEKSLYQQPEVLVEAQNRLVADPSSPPFWINCGTAYGQQHLVIWSALSPRNYYACMIAAQGRSPGLEENLLQTKGATMIPVTKIDHPLLQCFNLRNVIGVRTKEGPLKGQPWMEQVNGLGPFYFVQGVEVLASEAERWEWLRRGDWDPNKVAVVASLPDGFKEPSEPATFTITQASADQQELTTRGGGGLLVTSGLFYPGWKVQIDGQAAEALEVNGALRGVLVPAGEHTVLWTYSPRWVRPALLCFCAGCALLLGLALFGKRESSGAFS